MPVDMGLVFDLGSVLAASIIGGALWVLYLLCYKLMLA